MNFKYLYKYLTYLILTDINPADAALGAAMDSAMDQGGAPAPDTAAPMDDAAGMDGMDVPGMDDDPQDDSGSDIA